MSVPTRLHVLLAVCCLALGGVTGVAAAAVVLLHLLARGAARAHLSRASVAVGGGGLAAAHPGQVLHGARHPGGALAGAHQRGS